MADQDGSDSARGGKPEAAEGSLGRIMAERREKAARIREGGRNPYRNDVRPTHTCGEVRARYEPTRPEPAAPGTKAPEPGIVPIDGEVVRLAGRAVARRGFGKTVFMPIRDGSGDLQLFLNIDSLDPTDFAEVLPDIDVGDMVAAEGVAFWTRRGELSLLCRRVWLVTKSLRPLPEKWHGLTDVEIRYRQRYLDLATNPEVRDVFRQRSRIVSGIRAYLDRHDFLEVETPMMHTVIGGAAARPFITQHNALDMRLYMRIAPELYLKRLVVGGFERVYEIGRNFRNEGLSRTHNPEFTMLEFYQAYATYEDLMALTEELVVELARDVVGSVQVVCDGATIDLTPPWRRLTVRNAVIGAGVSEEVFDDPVAAAEAAIAAGAAPDAVLGALLEGLATGDATALGGARELGGRFRKPEERGAIARAISERLSEHDRRVRAGALAFLVFEHRVEASLVQPTFLCDFPVAVSPLARRKESDPALVDRFELFVGGREVANGFSELNDPDDQRARFQAQLRAREQGAAETMDYDEDYCRALEVGMPPTAGEGIGIDRLAMLLTGQTSIRDVILFPLMRAE
ncbi:MAG TPA: lysine--tRNA ligase [Kofleriaceae bacterium]|nr:lysine--tRNA ligase [Kofleriaceae bacterium]